MNGFEKMESLQPALQEAYKCIRGQWSGISERMAELAGPATGSVLIGDSSEQSLYLEWGRCNGSRKVFVRAVSKPSQSEKITGFDEWSFRMQMDMLKHADALAMAVADNLASLIVEASSVASSHAK